MPQIPDPEDWRKVTHKLSPDAIAGVEMAASALGCNRNAAARALLGAHAHCDPTVRRLAAEMVERMAKFAESNENKK